MFEGFQWALSQGPIMPRDASASRMAVRLSVVKILFGGMNSSFFVNLSEYNRIESLLLFLNQFELFWFKNNNLKKKLVFGLKIK